MFIRCYTQNELNVKRGIDGTTGSFKENEQMFINCENGSMLRNSNGKITYCTSFTEESKGFQIYLFEDMTSFSVDEVLNAHRKTIEKKEVQKTYSYDKKRHK